MFAKALFVAAAVVVGTITARAQTSSVTGSGTFGTEAASYICPPIAIFSHGLITFRLNVTGKHDEPGEATGVFQARCGGFNSSTDTVPITAIIEMTETRAWVRGTYDLERAGYSDCVDRTGNAKRRIPKKRFCPPYSGPRWNQGVVAATHNPRLQRRPRRRNFLQRSHVSYV